MVHIADPLTLWASVILICVVMGTCLLVGIAFLRRWQQIRYIRYVHDLKRRFRPLLARILAGERSHAGVAALQDLGLPDLELLLDPLFSKRKLPERCLAFLQSLCAELGLIGAWQARLANLPSMASHSAGQGKQNDPSGRAAMRHLLRAQSIRNLGTIRHQPSWPLLAGALDDRHPDIQLVALRALSAVGAPESFPVLRERLNAVVRGDSTSPPLQALRAALASFDLICVPSLLPSLSHPDRQIRLQATEILRTIVWREAGCRPDFVLTPELLSPALTELLVAGLPGDNSAEIRARSGEVLVFVADARADAALHQLLSDPQWFVRLRTVRAVARLPQSCSPLLPDIRRSLHDPHWRVREASVQTLLSLGPKGRLQLFESFLTAPDHAACEQIAEVIEGAGLVSSLVEKYGAGTTGLEALVVEQLASDAALLGVSDALRALNPEIRQRFLDRFTPHLQFRKVALPVESGPEGKPSQNVQRVIEFPPCLAA